MKSVGGLFERIVSPENLVAAMFRAARGKRQRVPVARFLADAETELSQLRQELLDQYRGDGYLAVRMIRSHDNPQRAARVVTVDHRHWTPLVRKAPLHQTRTDGDGSRRCPFELGVALILDISFTTHGQPYAGGEVLIRLRVPIDHLGQRDMATADSYFYLR